MSLLQVAARAVERRSRPAWVLDPAGGRVIATNGPGALRLGLAPGTGDFLIDKASPAYRAIRHARHRLTAVSAITDELAFWTPNGTERVMCVIERLRDGDGSLLIAEVSPDEEKIAHIVPERLHERAPASGAAPLLRDDTATLQEIARRIREGQKTLLAMPPAGTADQEQDGTSRHDGHGAAEVTPAAGAPAVAEPDKAVSVATLEPAAVETLFGSEPGPAARAAHELKTPIAAIAAAAEIVRDERLGPMDTSDGRSRYRDYAADIASNAHHALAVIDRMLGRGAAPEVRSIGMPAGAQVIDIAALAAAAVGAAGALAKRKQVTLTADMSPDLPRVAADATSLRQILLNLLTNAVKFTPAGGAVALSVSADRSGAVRLEVEDTGEVMTRAAVARALDPTLAVAAPSGPRPGGGLGLGLPLVLKLTKGMGARLMIDSVLGRGTRVTLLLPPGLVAPASPLSSPLN